MPGFPEKVWLARNLVPGYSNRPWMILTEKRARELSTDTAYEVKSYVPERAKD